MPAKSPVLSFQRLEREVLPVPIKGTAPLIVHKWSEKAKKQMLDKQMGIAAERKAPKDPVKDYEDSLYRMPDFGYGFPATGFKAAIVGAARYFDGITMTQLKASLFVIGTGPDQLIRIEGEPCAREDMVRISQETADIRYRGVFNDWSAVLQVKYLPSMLSEDAIVALVDAAGTGGIGEWRPSKADTGMFGTFEVSASALAAAGS